MKLIVTLTAAAFLLVASPLWAIEKFETKVKFANELRKKGYSDLALEYLMKLQKQAPASKKASLLRQIALVRLDLARDKSADERIQLITAAKGELDNFIKRNPKDAKARLELAKLTAYLGKAQYDKASLYHKDPPTRAKKAGIAIKTFHNAQKQLGVAIKVLKGKDKESRLDAQYTLGQALMNEAKAHSFTNDIRSRAKVVDAAIKVFTNIIKENANPPTERAYLSAAWLIRANQYKDAPTAALSAYKNIAGRTDKKAESAQALADYFYILFIPDNPSKEVKGLSGVKKWLYTVSEANKWLKKYAAYENTPEGHGIHYVLGTTYYSIAEQYKTKDKSGKATYSSKGNEYLDAAQKHFAWLAETNGEFAAKSKVIDLQISFMRMDKEKAIAKLQDFNECYLRAQWEMFKYRTASKEDERKKRIEAVVKAFRRALQLDRKDVRPSKLSEAKFLLASAYKARGDLYRAAVMGEAIARANPPSQYGPDAAAYAIEAYQGIMGKEENVYNRQRFRDLAEFILKEKKTYWGDHAVTSIAQFFLASMHLRRGDYADAMRLFDELSPNYPGYTYAQGQLVLTAQKARKSVYKWYPYENPAFFQLEYATIDPAVLFTKNLVRGLKGVRDAEKRKTELREKVFVALKRIPTLPKDTDASTALIFFFAHIQEPKLVYSDAIALYRKSKFKEAETKFSAMFKELAKQQALFNKHKKLLSEESQKQVSFVLNFYDKVARYSLADIAYRNGDFKQVVSKEVSGNLAAKIKKLGAKPGKIKLKDYDIISKMLSLNVRASVQLGKTKEGHEVLKLIARLSDPMESPLVIETIEQRAQSVLGQLVNEMQDKVAELRKKKKVKELKQTVANMSGFLDALTKDAEKKGFDPTNYFLLATCYGAIDQHREAAELFKVYHTKLNPEAINSSKKLDKDAKDERIKAYWFSIVKWAESLRKAGDATQEELTKAYSEMSKVKRNEEALGRREAEKEMIHILMKLEPPRYGTAVSMWQKFLASPYFRSNMDKRAVQEMFYDAYFNYVFCFYKYGEGHSNATKGKAYVRRAADLILRIENASNTLGWDMVGDKFKELLENEAKLKDVYDTLKKKS